MLKPIQLYSLISVGSQYIAVLEEINGPRLIPIWIGPAEGNAIALYVNGVTPPRPMTHDLFFSFFDVMEVKILKVAITQLKESTFYSSIFIRKKDKTIAVDARPSDAISLALRAKAPLFVEEDVFDQCEPLFKPISAEEVEEFKQTLGNLKPHDIYKDLKKGSKGQEQQ